MPTASQLDAKRLGTDLVIRDTVNRGLLNNGQAPVVSGRPNIRQVIEHIVSTSPGELIHRPNYGGGLTESIGTLNSPSNQARALNKLRDAILRDPRFQDVSLALSNGPTPGTVRIQVRFVLATEAGTENFETTISIPGL